MEEQEISIELNVLVNKNTGIEHGLDIETKGYTADDTQRIKDIINEDIRYFIEDIRRRITII